MTEGDMVYFLDTFDIYEVRAVNGRVCQIWKDGICCGYTHVNCLKKVCKLENKY